jgi:hypothetical protein
LFVSTKCFFLPADKWSEKTMRTQAGTPEGPNPKRVAAGKRNRAKWKGFTEDGLQRLRAAIFRAKPWRFTKGPRTPEGKAKVALNGKKCQLGPISVAEAKAEVAGLWRTHGPERVPHRVISEGSEAGTDITVFLELALQETFDVPLVLWGDPALFDEQVGQRRVLVHGPERAGLDEAVGAKQVGLEREDSEEQVAVCVHGAHGARLGHATTPYGQGRFIAPDRSTERLRSRMRGTLHRSLSHAIGGCQGSAVHCIVLAAAVDRDDAGMFQAAGAPGSESSFRKGLVWLSQRFQEAPTIFRRFGRYLSRRPNCG